MWRKVTAICLAVSMMVLTCACGKSGTVTYKGETDTNPDKGLEVMGDHVTYDPNHLVNDGDPIELDWWLWDAPDLFGSIAEEYEKIHPNVTIHIINNPWDGFWTKLPLALQKGEDGPTLFNVHNSYQHLLLNYMEPYDIDIQDLEEDFFTAKSHEIDGKIYYMDFGIMTGAIYYNKDMWAAAGLTEEDIPKTWDEFREVAKKLTIMEDGKMVQAGFNFNGDFENLMQGVPYQYGDTIFDETGTVPRLTQEGQIETAQMFLDFYEKDHVGDKDFGTDAAQSFGQGQSAMVYRWGHFYGYMETNYPDINYGTFEIPTATEDPFAYDRYNGESTPGINKNATPEQKEVAQDFIRFYLANQEKQKELCMNYSLFPSNNALRDDKDLLKNPAIQAVSEHIDNYIWPGAMPATLGDNLKIACQDMMYNNTPVEEALQNAEDIVKVDLSNQEFVASENLYYRYSEHQ
ncbi:MAG: extracellular solute-binding protein [Dorea sp.]|nr:extracellular solute-binding protein [Dorea sp.]MDY2814272.1 extracellular solute-binding protein [Dorea sp.]